MNCMIKTHYLQRTNFIRDSKVDIASRLYDRGIAVHFRAECKDFSSVQNVRALCGANQASFSVGNGNPFHAVGGKSMSWLFIVIDSASLQTPLSTDTVVRPVVLTHKDPHRAGACYVFNRPSLQDKHQTATWTHLTKRENLLKRWGFCQDHLFEFLLIYFVLFFSPSTPFNYVTIDSTS